MKRIIACLLLSVLLTAGCQLLPPEAEEAPIDVMAPIVTQRETTVVRRGTIESRLSVNLSLGAEQQTALYFRGNGLVRQLHVSLGQEVTPGQLLAELEAGSLPYDLANAEIDYEKARLNLANAQARKGFVDSPSEADLRRYELDVQQAEIKVARLQEQVADTRIYAPYAGQILSLSLREGDIAEAYKEIFILAAIGPIVARATVDEATASQLQPGLPAEIFPSDGDPTPIPGTILSVPLVGSTAKSQVILIHPNEPSTRLRAGRNGRAEIILEAKDEALLLPLSAIRSFSGRKFVTVLTGETRQEVTITTGLEDDQNVEVLSGLHEGDQVISR